MGCSAGSASVPYAESFPDAEVHAIDIGSGMLRYAHARAESLGVAVHFHQMDAAATGFPDAYFDLIVSHNMMHEISDATRLGMLRETWRLLAPGGVAVHQDVPLRFAGLSEFQKFEMSWDTRNNRLRLDGHSVHLGGFGGTGGVRWHEIPKTRADGAG